MPRFDRLEFGSQPASKSDRAQARSPTDERHWLRQADIERRKGLYEAALRCYSRALEHDKAAVVAWTGQVQMLVFLDEAPEADLWSRKALELFPGNGELLAARSQAVCRQENLESALALSDAALAAAGQSSLRWVARGEVMLALAQSTDRHCFDKAYQIQNDWLVRSEAANIYLRYRKPAQAQRLGREAVERAPDEPFAWYVCGRAEAAQGLNRQARHSFLRCLELSPAHHLANQAIAALERRTGGWLSRLWSWRKR